MNGRAKKGSKWATREKRATHIYLSPFFVKEKYFRLIWANERENREKKIVEKW